MQPSCHQGGTILKKTFVALLFGFSLTTASAVGYDLKNCMFDNGLPMHPKACESLKNREQEKAVERERGMARNAQLKMEREKSQAAEAANYERQKLESQEREQKRLAAIEERQLAIDSERREEEKRDALQAKAAAGRQATLKSECGKDYKAITIGMPIQRAQRCVANLKLIGQINRADGVVSTYQAGRIYAHVMDGKIVSWGK